MACPWMSRPHTVPGRSRTSVRRASDHFEARMSVSVETRQNFVPSTPKLLFQANYGKEHRNDVNYDVSPDGRRFLMTRPVEGQTGGFELNVVLNWYKELKQRFPVK
jgi:hypothetical protein